MYVVLAIKYSLLCPFICTVPSPSGLGVVRELHNSVLISWTPALSELIQAYHIYVDGQFNMAVKSEERAKALIEDVNSDMVSRFNMGS